MGPPSRWLGSFWHVIHCNHNCYLQFHSHITEMNHIFSLLAPPQIWKACLLLVLNVLTYLVSLPLCGWSAIFIDPPPPQFWFELQTIYVEALSPKFDSYIAQHVHLFIGTLLRHWHPLLEHCQGEFCSPNHRPRAWALSPRHSVSSFTMDPFCPSCLDSDTSY